MNDARLPMCTTTAPLRIMLIDPIAERLDVLASTLAAAGHRIVARLDRGADLHAEVLRVEPDVVIIDIDAPDRDILEDMHAINRERPRPILVFTQDDNPALIRAACIRCSTWRSRASNNSRTCSVN